MVLMFLRARQPSMKNAVSCELHGLINFIQLLGVDDKGSNVIVVSLSI